MVLAAFFAESLTRPSRLMVTDCWVLSVRDKISSAFQVSSAVGDLSAKHVRSLHDTITILVLELRGGPSDYRPLLPYV